MLEIAIPGFAALKLEFLVLDFNGTLAKDGELLPGVWERLDILCRELDTRVITADTHGTVRGQMRGLRLAVNVLEDRSLPEDQAKDRMLRDLGADKAVFVGNGANDCLALATAALGIAVCQAEGVSPRALAAADVMAPNILAALDLLRFPKRLVATLRV